MITEDKKREIAEKVVDEKMYGNLLSWIMLIAFGSFICLIPFIIWGSTWFYLKIALTSLFVSIVSYVVRDIVIDAVLKVVNEQASAIKTGDKPKSRFEEKIQKLAKEKENKGF